MTSRDPEYITPAIKVMLRRKNKLMRAGRVEEAGALAKRIGSDITSQCKGRLSKYGAKMDAKTMWDAVRKLTGRQQEFPDIDSINAESLNNHYATISTDLNYTAPVSSLRYVQYRRVSMLPNTRFLKHLTNYDHPPPDWMKYQLGFLDWGLQSLPNRSRSCSTAPSGAQWFRGSGNEPELDLSRKSACRISTLIFDRFQLPRFSRE